MAATVRLAGPADLTAMQALDPGRARLMKTWIDAHYAFVALDGAEVLGLAVLTRHFFGQGFIELLLVDARARRRGFATALLGHLEASSPTATLWTSTNESNAPMRALLAAAGYTLSGAIEGLDEGDPELVFRKRVRQA